jgi:ribbon-helix-helix CopG family protein
MLMLDRRLQILIDDRRYRRLSEAARKRGTSVAVIVREAIDQALPDDAERKRAAARALLSAEPITLPDDPADLKAEIRGARGA